MLLLVTLQGVAVGRLTDSINKKTSFACLALVALRPPQAETKVT
jgi:hypothetical protein